MTGSNSPRPTGLNPMAKPTGTEIATARASAQNTRPRLAARCCASVASAKPLPETVMSLCSRSIAPARPLAAICSLSIYRERVQASSTAPLVGGGILGSVLDHASRTVTDLGRRAPGQTDGLPSICPAPPSGSGVISCCDLIRGWAFRARETRSRTAVRSRSASRAALRGQYGLPLDQSAPRCTPSGSDSTAPLATARHPRKEHFACYFLRSRAK